MSDRGTHFINDTIKSLLDTFMIQHQKSSPYHPQANGTVEVFNKFFEKGLTKICNAQWDDWDERLPAALWAYRTAFKTPLGTTPCHLLYGKWCQLPIKLEHKAAWAIKLLNFDIKPAAERRLMQFNELDEIRHLVYESSKIYKEKTKAYHDKKIISRHFEPNESSSVI